jgi:hypothetical protein
MAVGVVLPIATRSSLDIGTWQHVARKVGVASIDAGIDNRDRYSVT